MQKLRGDSLPSEIAATMKNSPPPIKVVLIEILTNRRALDAIGEILIAALDNEANVRTAAMAALGEMASAQHLPEMLAAVLKSSQGAERTAAERAVAVVCSRIDDSDVRANTVLAPWSKLNEQSQRELLPTLGRVGGPNIYSVVKAALASDSASRRDSGLQASAIGPTPPLLAIYCCRRKKPRAHLIGR